jgi:predicted metalloprotease with PDZ domain
MTTHHHTRAATATAWLLGALSGLAVAEDGQPPAPAAELHYTVTLRSPADQRVEVSAELTGIDPSVPAVHWKMQQRFAFVRLPEPLLDGAVTATAAGAELTCERRSAWEWVVTPGGQSALRLRYVVPLTHRTLDAVKTRDAYEYPYVADDHGMLVTPTLFAHPDNISIGRMRVRFELPDGWEVVAPWRPAGEGEFDPGTTEALLNDLVAIGAWSVHRIRIGDFEGTIALAPGQDTLERAVVEPIRQIVACELALFGRPAAGRYLFLFSRPEIQGLAGSPKTNSMTLAVEPRLAPMAGRYLPHLIAHEFFHTWAAGVQMPGELRWVNEGFTDYYAYLVPARLKLSTWEEFARTLGEKMQSCAANPLRARMSLAAAGGEVFFRDKNAYNLVYDGGLLLAAWLDRAMRQRGDDKTLDDLMRALNNNPRWADGTEAPTLDTFIAQVQQFTSAETAEQLRRFVTRAYDFDPVAEFTAVGVAVQPTRTPPRMDLRANLDGTKVLDMDQSWITYEVGIRPGDRLTKINGQPVTNAGEVRTAWRKPVDGRIRVTLERGGKKVNIDEPLADTRGFDVPAEPWQEHQ